MKATGHASWSGSWKQGSGAISTASPVLPAASYSYASRFEGAAGASPEELLAAAHAGCFNQALANNLGMIGLTAGRIDTTVVIDLGRDEQDRPSILSSAITVRAAADGATDEQLQYCAGRAATNCAISKVLRCEIRVQAALAT